MIYRENIKSTTWTYISKPLKKHKKANTYMYKTKIIPATGNLYYTVFWCCSILVLTHSVSTIRIKLISGNTWGRVSSMFSIKGLVLLFQTTWFMVDVVVQLLFFPLLGRIFKKNNMHTKSHWQFLKILPYPLKIPYHLSQTFTIVHVRSSRLLY